MADAPGSSPGSSGSSGASSPGVLTGFERDGLVFDVRDGGPRDGEVVVLLHGFPQDSTAWSQVEPILHAAGLRTLAPDQRGYSPGARPGGVAAYRLKEVSADVVALLDAAGVERAHVAGHDWGGAVVWDVTQRHPGRFRDAVVVSTPHPSALAWSFTHSLQAARSSYMGFFQVPVLAEAAVAPALERVLTSSGLPAERARHYAGRMREPGALTGALGWYRAFGTGLAQGLVPRRLRPAPRGSATYRSPGSHWPGPTTYVWGQHDPTLGRAAAERTGEYVRGDYRFVEVDGGHWLPETHPREVAGEILARAQSKGRPGPASRPRPTSS
jgi:pimeloyl-ACP methyl ester carboxylesterase